MIFQKCSRKFCHKTFYTLRVSRFIEAVQERVAKLVDYKFSLEDELLEIDRTDFFDFLFRQQNLLVNMDKNVIIGQTRVSVKL